MVLCDMILIGRPDKRSVLFEVDLHDTETWGVAGREVDCYTLAESVV